MFTACGLLTGFILYLLTIIILPNPVWATTYLSVNPIDVYAYISDFANGPENQCFIQCGALTITKLEKCLDWNIAYISVNVAYILGTGLALD